MLATSPEPASAPKLGIIAGSTDLPRLIAESCLEQGREFIVLAVEGACQPETVEDLPHEWIRLGGLTHAITTLKQEGAEELVMAGKITRPKLSGLRPDLKATKLLARLGSTLFKGDDELIRTIISFLEDEGFRVIGVDDVTRQLLAPEGLIGSIYPDKRAQQDIEFGARIAEGIGALDIGQAVIVQNQQVLGVEAIEGTAELIKRCGPLKVEAKGGVLVKCKKPIQERRVDLPTIGIATIDQLAEAGFAGLAIEAGSTLMVDKRGIIARANELGLFIVGFSVDPSSANESHPDHAQQPA